MKLSMLIHPFLITLSKFYKKLYKKQRSNYFGKPILPELEGNSYIKEKLQTGRPVMISRLGSTELRAICNRLIYCPDLPPPSHDKKNNSLKVIFSCLRSGGFDYLFNDSSRHALMNSSGFFPDDKQLYDRFCFEFIDAIKNVDVMGVWFNAMEDYICHKYCPDATLVRLRSLEPYYHENPWSISLEGKNVLVIHPFDTSIKEQYKKRELLFANKKTLPDFHLDTIRAVQSIAQNKTQFETWFDAKDYMCDQILTKDFDIAIIGAGAYGLPLASFVKSIGKQAVHMGGATQILFGIKGKGWEQHEIISKMFNQHWSRPHQDEVPNNHTIVGGGVYW